jgi:hypothetical protein
MSDQVRHAVSDPYAGPCPAAHVQSPHRPIPHTEFGIRKPEIRNPRAPSMERYPAVHGAVQNILSYSLTFPVDG